MKRCESWKFATLRVAVVRGGEVRVKEAIKALIRPIQMQFLKRGMCVACGMPLSKADRVSRDDGTEKVTCKCGRVYVFNPADQSYRRANFNEV